MCRSWRLAVGCSFHTVALTRSSSKDSVSPGNFTEVSFDSRLCSLLAGGEGAGKLIQAGQELEQDGDSRQRHRKKTGRDRGRRVRGSREGAGETTALGLCWCGRENGLWVMGGGGERKLEHKSKQERGGDPEHQVPGPALPGPTYSVAMEQPYPSLGLSLPSSQMGWSVLLSWQGRGLGWLSGDGDICFYKGQGLDLQGGISIPL